MKLLKKIISVICAVSLIANYAPAFASSFDTTVYVNEIFDNFPTNAVPDTLTIKSGHNARVIEVGNNKVFYAGAQGCPVKFSIPNKASGSKLIFSYDIMISGDPVKGSAFGLTSGKKTVNLLNYMPSREINLEDSMRISGYSSGMWHTYTFAVDFNNGAYDLYIDGKMKLDNRRFYTAPSIPEVIDFNFACVDDKGSSEIYVDNIRIYEGNNILSDKNFKSPAKNTQILEYTPSERVEATYDRVFLDSNSKQGISISLTAKADNIAAWEPMEDGGTPYLHFLQGGANDCYGDINVDIPVDVTKYIYQLDAYVVKNTGYLRMGMDASGSNTFFQLKGNSLTHNGVSAGTIEYGKWVRIAAAVDTVNETCTIYKDGKLVKSDIPLQLKNIPSKIRVGIASNSTTGSEVYFNKFKVYEGVELREFDDADPEIITDGDAAMQMSMTTSIHENAANVQYELGNDVVFMTTSDYFYAFGKKHKYSDYGTKSWINDAGKVMVDSSVLKFVFDKGESDNKSSLVLEGKVFALTEKDGSFFADSSDVAKKLGKYIYDTDNRSFVIISDTNKSYYNSTFSDENRDPVDRIWRYMQFDRPDSDEIFNLLSHSDEFKTHPRLLIKKNQIPQLKNRINSNSSLKQMFVKVLDDCDKIIDSPPAEHKFQADGFRMFSACSVVKERLFTLCTAYILTGSKRYAERAWIELDNACSWPDWNLEIHFLDSGEMATGIAYAYDTLYDYLSYEQKESVRRRVEKLYLDYCVGMFTGESPDNVSRQKYTISNWGAVTGAAMLMVALTFMDEEAPDSLFTQKCKYIVSNTMQTFEHYATVLAPEGTWHEGGGYAEFVLQHFAWVLLSLKNVLGIDNNFIATPGVCEQPIYTMMVTTKNGVFNKSSTTGAPKYFAPETMIYARLNNRPDLVQLYSDYRKLLGIDTFDVNYLLFYDPEYANNAENPLQLDRYFAGVGTSVSRYSWVDSEGLFLAVSGGETNSTRDSHYDKGSFIFEVLGQRWLIDMGRNGNNTMPYLKRTESHNALVINPTADYEGQQSKKVAAAIDSESKIRGAKFIYDLTSVYGDDVKSYKRGFFVTDNRNSLIVQDEFELKKESELLWNFITEANVELSADGKSAILTQKGEKLKVTADGNISDWKFEVRDMAPTGGWTEDPFAVENTVEKQQKFAANAKKLVISTKAKGNVSMAVKFVPQIEGEPYPDAKCIAMSEWTIPDGILPPKPMADMITANGEPIPDFMPGVKDYRLTYPYGSDVPVIGALVPNGSVEIIQASDWTESAEVKVVLSDGRYRIYKINFSIEEKIVDDILATSTAVGLPSTSKIVDVKSIYASHEPQKDNNANNATDGKFETRWSADTQGSYIEVDLGSVQELTGVAIAWSYAAERNYHFDILVSENKMDYKRIYSGYSAGGTNDFEFIQAPVKARFVRYVGYGHKAGSWNSVTEFRPAVAK